MLKRLVLLAGPLDDGELLRERVTLVVILFVGDADAHTVPLRVGAAGDAEPATDRVEQLETLALLEELPQTVLEGVAARGEGDVVGEPLTQADARPVRDAAGDVVGERDALAVTLGERDDRPLPEDEPQPVALPRALKETEAEREPDAHADEVRLATAVMLPEGVSLGDPLEDAVAATGVSLGDVDADTDRDSTALGVSDTLGLSDTLGEVE